MARVVKYLLQSGGDVAGYLDHMCYVFRLAATGEYVDSALVGYDRSLIDAVIAREIMSFIPGYPLASCLHFHASNMVRNQISVGRGRGRGRGRGGRSDRKGIPPEGFPDHICYDYNYRSCDGCSKSHVCRVCNGTHRAINCPRKKENRDQ